MKMYFLTRFTKILSHVSWIWQLKWRDAIEPSNQRGVTSSDTGRVCLLGNWIIIHRDVFTLKEIFHQRTCSHFVCWEFFIYMYISSGHANGSATVDLLKESLPQTSRPRRHSSPRMSKFADDKWLRCWSCCSAVGDGGGGGSQAAGVIIPADKNLTLQLRDKKPVEREASPLPRTPGYCNSVIRSLP